MDRNRKLSLIRPLVQEEVNRTRLSSLKYLLATVGIITSATIAAVAQVYLMLIPLAISIAPAVFLTFYQYNSYSTTKRLLKKIDSELNVITAEWRLIR